MPTDKDDLIGRIASTLKGLGVTGRRSTVLAAVSGGIDSMVLLDLLDLLGPRLGFEVIVAHVDHGVREGSGADAAFVARQAEERCLECRVSSLADEAFEADEAPPASENTLREGRWRALAALADEVGAEVVATGHTRDDQAETILLHLLRGAGLKGLVGMTPGPEPLPVVGGARRVVRPLLDESRETIEAYARRRGLEHREDPTNKSDGYLRNRIRHHVVPLLTGEVNPKAVEHLVAMGKRVGEALEVVQGWITATLHGVVTELPGEVSLPVETILGVATGGGRALVVKQLLDGLYPEGAIGQSHVDAVVALASTTAGEAALHLPDGGRAIRRGSELTLLRAGAALDEAPLWYDQDATWELLPGGEVILGPLTISAHVVELPCPFPDEEVGVVLSPVTPMPLTVRFPRVGARMTPYGMGGHTKLVRDILADAKLPASERPYVPVVEACDEILWLVGHRRGAGWPVVLRAGEAILVTVTRTT